MGYRLVWRQQAATTPYMRGGMASARRETTAQNREKAVKKSSRPADDTNTRARKSAATVQPSTAAKEKETESSATYQGEMNVEIQSTRQSTSSEGKLEQEGGRKKRGADQGLPAVRSGCQYSVRITFLPRTRSGKEYRYNKKP